MKMMLCNQRHPDMSRTQFFHHLRHIHAPMVAGIEAMREHLLGYVQNHALGPDLPDGISAPYRIASERDSVIELFVESEDGLKRMVAVPEYLEKVRPDEARFNNLPTNIMVKAIPEELFNAGVTGRCKRFDYLVRSASCDAAEFRSAISTNAQSLALNPAYTGRIDRHVHNWPIAADPANGGQGFGTGQYDCLRELWSGSFENLALSAGFLNEAHLVDPEQSFSVYATEFPMIPPVSI